MKQQTRDRAALQTRTVCLAIQTTECITAFKSEMSICLFEEESTKNLGKNTVYGIDDTDA